MTAVPSLSSLDLYTPLLCGIWWVISWSAQDYAERCRDRPLLSLSSYPRFYCTWSHSPPGLSGSFRFFFVHPLPLGKKLQPFVFSPTPRSLPRRPYQFLIPCALYRMESVSFFSPSGRDPTSPVRLDDFRFLYRGENFPSFSSPSLNVLFGSHFLPPSQVFSLQLSMLGA